MPWPFSGKKSISNIDALDLVSGQLYTLLEDNKLSKGLFRIPGNAKRIKAYMTALNQATDKWDIPAVALPHDMTGVIKQLLKHITNDQFVKKHFSKESKEIKKLLQKNKPTTGTEKVIYMDKKIAFNDLCETIIRKTPALEKLFDIFLLVENHQEITQMPPNNIAKILAPTFIDLFSGEKQKKTQSPKDLQKISTFEEFLSFFLEKKLKECYPTIKPKKHVHFAPAIIISQHRGQPSKKLDLPPEIIWLKNIADSILDKKSHAEIKQMFMGKINRSLFNNEKIIIHLDGYTGSVSLLLLALQDAVYSGEINANLSFTVIATDTRYQGPYYKDLFDFLKKEKDILEIYSSGRIVYSPAKTLMRENFKGTIEVIQEKPETLPKLRYQK